MSQIPMTRSEEMLAFHDGHFGGTAFVGLAGGDILFSEGRRFSVSSDGGITWSEPYHGLDEKGEPLTAGNASFVNLPGDAIGMTTRRIRPGSANIYEPEMVFRTSEDQGKSWSPITVMNQGLLPAHGLSDTMIRTESGRLILPVYFGIGQGGGHQEGAPFPGAYLNGNFVSTSAHFFDPHFCASYVLYSDDEGQTWRKNHDGEILIIMEYGGRWELTNEPTLVEVTAGKLLMLLRTRLGRLYQCRSEDNGETWTRPAPTQLAGTQAPAQVRKLPRTGHLLVVWTQQSEREIKQGFIRTRLSSAISRNQGRIWEHFQNVESLHEETHVEPGPIYPVRPEGAYGAPDGAVECDPEYVLPLPEGYGMWSYPSVFVAEDRVLISYNHFPSDGAGQRTREERDALRLQSLPAIPRRMKVLPLSWFYGGQDPESENPTLDRIVGHVRGEG
jgi:hypothetical protein